MNLKDYKTTAQAKASAYGIPVFCAHDKICPITDLKPNPQNPNKHPKKQIAMLGQIIKATGWRQPITVSARSGYIVKGHGRYMAAMAAGLKAVPVDVQNYTSEAEEHADLVADNRIAELADIDNELLAGIFNDINLDEIPAELTGYTSEEFQNIANALADELQSTGISETIPDTLPEIISQPGDLWVLGRHRVLCGDCTSEKNRQILFNGAKPEILLTDPPYCSGGFQEAGRREGSKGSTDKKESNLKIANDTLSTRGYQTLIKSILTHIPCKVVYIFTDWRMWVYLFDLVESSGYGVKNMLVWDKQAVGMGYGWRTQHELIMFAHKTKPAWDNHKGYSNVLSCKRQTNELHPTQSR